MSLACVQHRDGRLNPKPSLKFSGQQQGSIADSAQRGRHARNNLNDPAISGHFHSELCRRATGKVPVRRPGLEAHSSPLRASARTEAIGGDPLPVPLLTRRPVNDDAGTNANRISYGLLGDELARARGYKQDIAVY